MDETFLAIIAVLASGYSFYSRQPRLGFGFLIYVVVFILLIPALSSGIKSDIFTALAMILFVIGSLLIVSKPRKNQEKDEAEKTD